VVVVAVDGNDHVVVGEVLAPVHCAID